MRFDDAEVFNTRVVSYEDTPKYLKLDFGTKLVAINHDEIRCWSAKPIEQEEE